jgi:hypothetical protein
MSWTLKLKFYCFWLVPMQAFIVSIVAGCLFPLFPVIAEFGLQQDVSLATWAVTSIVYTAAVGLSSRNQAVAIPGLFCSALSVLIYSASTLADGHHAAALFIHFGKPICYGLISIFLIAYVVERFIRHCVEAQSFLEIEA